MTGAARTILALDCSAAACSAALWRGGGLAAHRFAEMGRGQAEALMPMVETVMHDAATRYAELDLVVATVGPGSFTGLRIGLAAARGIALAAGVPARGITSFAALADAIPADRLSGRRLAVAIDDRRGGIYWQAFDATRQPDGDPAALSRDQIPSLLAGRQPGPGLLPGLLVVGDGTAALDRELDRELLGRGHPAVELYLAPLLPDAACVARLAADPGFSRRGLLPPAPLYLRAADATLPAPHPFEALP